MYPEDFHRRFWAKVALCLHGTGCAACCWLWQGAKTGNGYGCIWAPPALRQEGVRYIAAPKAAWEMRHGRVPPGLWVLHNCPMGDNPLCVNTNGHLWLGTARDNNHDMMQKGRQIFLHGEDVRHAKLTEPDIYAICALRDALSQDAIAQRFGIAQTTVGDILRGEKWRHVRRDTPPRRPHAEQVATLTRDQVYAIRRLQGTMTEAKAAARFGVSGSQIGRIWKRECWAWLPEEENR